MFERTEIKDVVAYLRLIANEDDDPAFVRALSAPKRGVGHRRGRAQGVAERWCFLADDDDAARPLGTAATTVRPGQDYRQGCGRQQ